MEYMCATANYLYINNIILVAGNLEFKHAIICQNLNRNTSNQSEAIDDNSLN